VLVSGIAHRGHQPRRTILSGSFPFFLWVFRCFSFVIQPVFDYRRRRIIDIFFTLDQM
jgi:hypothetical protein